MTVHDTVMFLWVDRYDTFPSDSRAVGRFSHVLATTFLEIRSVISQIHNVTLFVFLAIVALNARILLAQQSPHNQRYIYQKINFWQLLQYSSLQQQANSSLEVNDKTHPDAQNP